MKRVSDDGPQNEINICKVEVLKQGINKKKLNTDLVVLYGSDLRMQHTLGQLGQLSLASLRGRLIEYQLRLG